jgi:hypothetical protein
LKAVGRRPGTRDQWYAFGIFFGPKKLEKMVAFWLIKLLWQFFCTKLPKTMNLLQLPTSKRSNVKWMFSYFCCRQVARTRKNCPNLSKIGYIGITKLHTKVNFKRI